jgi:hypothetical protein
MAAPVARATVDGYAGLGPEAKPSLLRHMSDLTIRPQDLGLDGPFEETHDAMTVADATTGRKFSGIGLRPGSSATRHRKRSS